VLAVGLQRDRAVPAAGADKPQSNGKVDERGADGDRQPDTDVGQRPRIDQPVCGGDADRDRRQNDQPSFDSSREVLGLRMTIRVLLVGRLGRPLQRTQGDYRCHQVHERLGGVRQ
jgi:hypothetical protein